jgi:hypothetical protein
MKAETYSSEGLSYLLEGPDTLLRGVDGTKLLRGNVTNKLGTFTVTTPEGEMKLSIEPHRHSEDVYGQVYHCLPQSAAWHKLEGVEGGQGWSIHYVRGTYSFVRNPRPSRTVVRVCRCSNMGGIRTGTSRSCDHPNMIDLVEVAKAVARRVKGVAELKAKRAEAERKRIKLSHGIKLYEAAKGLVESDRSFDVNPTPSTAAGWLARRVHQVAALKAVVDEVTAELKEVS